MRKVEVGQIVYEAYRPKKLAVVTNVSERPAPARPSVMLESATIRYADGTTKTTSPHNLMSIDLLIEKTSQKLENHIKRRDEFMETLKET